MKLCQIIFWCLACLIFWQSFKSIGSIEESNEPQNFIETYNMLAVIYVSVLLVLSENLPSYIFLSTNHNFRVKN